MTEFESQGDQVLAFKGSRYWTSNVWGAVVAGIGGGTLMSVVAIIVLSGSPSPKIMLFMGGWVLILLVAVLAWFPGNAIARFPYEVMVEKGKGLRIRAPLKELFIPIQEVRDVSPSFPLGFVIRLKHRQRFLTQIFIHKLFGSRGKPLADAIREEIERCVSSG
ncbi:MAG TPA: hypothetical protein VFA74_04175 [Terriglobales bacterium]|nr:hypothetical protein [Terriglobales bacterium]